MELSNYQQTIWDEIADRLETGRNVVGHAVAGSGKSFLQVKLIKELVVPMLVGKRIALLAFNSHIKVSNELKLKGTGAKSLTYHGFGFSMIKGTYKRAEFAPNKMDDYLYPILKAQWSNIVYSIKQLVSLCKGDLVTQPTYDELTRYAFEHDVPLFDKKDDSAKHKIFDMVGKAILYSIETPLEVDFDDMIFLPNVLDAVQPVYQAFIGIDELQDTNYAQRQLIAMCSERGYTLNFGVGDRKQAIYYFRGAGATSIDDFKEQFTADEYPLSISYRCPRAVARLVNQEFPNIRFEIPDWAIEGSVSRMTRGKALETLHDHDLVLCRVNADNVKMCLDLLRMGKKAIIRGEDTGKGLLRMINESKVEDIRLFPDYMEAWRQQEVSKARFINSKNRAKDVEERFDVMMALMSNCLSMDELRSRCQKMFGDKDVVGVLISTIHRAKGLEFKRVFLIRPDLLPHPAAESMVEKEQEGNLTYVAYTRAIEDFIFVD